MMADRFRSTNVGLLILLALPLLIGGGKRQDITLVHVKQSEYTIVISPNSSPSQRYAAEELVTVIEQISGARLAVSNKATDGPMVLVGPSAVLESVLPEIDYQALGEEGLVIRTVGPHLVLTGGPPRGTLYAVYEFLDGELGCRGFADEGVTPAVTHIPRQSTIQLGPLNKTKVPALEYRSAWYREAFAGDWAARNRLNGQNTAVTEKHGGKNTYYRTQAWHTFKYFINAGEIGERPELFAFNNGKRSTSQLCTSHPQVVDRVTEMIRFWISQDPKAKFFSVIANDGGGFCTCELCGPLTDYERSRAAPVLHLTNLVADRIRDEHPDVMLDTLAYSPTCPPPRFARPRDNVMVRFATAQACRAHPIDENCGDSWHMAEFLREWGERCGQMYVWDYQTVFSNYLQPFPNFHTLQPNIQYFVKNNVKGVFNQAPSSGGGEFAELRAYLLARVMWDPQCDFASEMEKFLQAYYGTAAEAIEQYITMMRGHVAWGPKQLKPLPTNVICPASGRLMLKHPGEHQPFLACDEHPNCQGVLRVRGSEVELPERRPLATDAICPMCGEGLELRRSFYHGPWLICSRFPGCVGRIAWSTLAADKQAELEQALQDHEEQNPQMKIRTNDGKVYEAGGEPLHVLLPREDSNPWMKVDSFGSVKARYLTKDIIQRAGKIFDKAEADAADDPVLLSRVRKERLAVEVVRISRPDEFLPTLQAYEQAVESFAQVAADWKINQIREGGNLEKRIQLWRERIRKLQEAAGQ